MIHVGITGSKEWTGIKKIKDFLFVLNKKYNDDIEIITCGEQKWRRLYSKNAVMIWNDL